MLAATRHGVCARRRVMPLVAPMHRPRPQFCAMDSESPHEGQLTRKPSPMPDHRTLVHLCLRVCARGEAGLFPVMPFTFSDWLLYFSKGRPDHAPVLFCFVFSDPQCDLRDYLS